MIYSWYIRVLLCSFEDNPMSFSKIYCKNSQPWHWGVLRRELSIFYPESLLTTVLIFNFKFKNVWVKKNNFIDEYFISITTLWLQITLKFWTFSIIHDLKATTFWTTVKILHSMGIEKWENLLRRAEYKFRAPPA